jgi:hypothetical protein
MRAEAERDETGEVDGVERRGAEGGGEEGADVEEDDGLVIVFDLLLKIGGARYTLLGAYHITG